MNYFISLDEAKKMTALYRQQKENILSQEYKGKDILSICETFDSEPFTSVLSKPECKKLRIYFGMSEDLKVHVIFVGVNENNEDLLPAVSTPGTTITFDIGEQGQLCPPICPPPSPLNS